MFTRYRILATLTAALLAAGALSNAVAAESPDVSLEHQVEMAQTQADHQAVAKRFEDEAAQLEKQAGEHERLAKRYRGGIGVGPKTNAASLASHCDSMVKNLRASATDAREMARLHRDVAKQLAK